MAEDEIQKTNEFQTSGTSILGDHPYTGTDQSAKIWSDEKDDMFAMEKENPERYGQRVTDVAVVETGKSLGVKTYIVVPPTICMLNNTPKYCTICSHLVDGKGSGPFATLSQQVPNLARLARKRGSAVVIETGKGVSEPSLSYSIFSLLTEVRFGIMCTSTIFPTSTSVSSSLSLRNTAHFHPVQRLSSSLKVASIHGSKSARASPMPCTRETYSLRTRSSPSVSKRLLRPLLKEMRVL